MQSSFNVIKQSRIKQSNSKTISTDYDLEDKKDDEELGVLNENGITYEEAKKYVESYEKIGNSIIEDARKRKEEYIKEASCKALEIEKSAYDKGYEQGNKNGYEDGYNDAYEKGKLESEGIISKANDYLKLAKDEYSDYLDSKKKDIIDLVFEVSKKVLNAEIDSGVDISSMVEDAIKLAKDEKNVIIRCNESHVDDLKKNIDIWKPSFNIKDAIFVLQDNNIEKGRVIIEKDSGIIEVGIDIGLDKIRNALMSN